MTRTNLWLAAGVALAASLVTKSVQAQVPRILVQDPALDNLVTPHGYETAPLGTLGNVVRRGTGPDHMILIPGLGFGSDVFGPLMDSLSETHTMWAVTLPGLAGTAAPPTPPPGTSFGEQTWTNGALTAIEALLADEGIQGAVVVGHWLTGTQLAVRLAARNPDRIRRVVLLAGSARMIRQEGAPIPPLDERVAFIDQSLAPRWFKTVTRETWDDNNFLPHDYAVDPVLGLRLWREAARPALHVWIRYLCEFHAQDTTEEIAALDVPVLLLLPGLEGLVQDPANPYLSNFTAGGWGSAARPGVEVRTIPHTRVVMWADAPGIVAGEIRGFIR